MQLLGGVDYMNLVDMMSLTSFERLVERNVTEFALTSITFFAVVTTYQFEMSLTPPLGVVTIILFGCSSALLMSGLSALWTELLTYISGLIWFATFRANL